MNKLSHNVFTEIDAEVRLIEQMSINQIEIIHKNPLLYKTSN